MFNAILFIATKIENQPQSVHQRVRNVSYTGEVSFSDLLQ
jgi:hypothetical protein